MYFDEEWYFIGGFKFGSMPGILNKEVLAQLIYNLEKFGKIITLCILMKEGHYKHTTWIPC